MLSRRKLVGASLLAGWLRPVSAACPRPEGGDGDALFRLGIASGDPGPDSVILWTRVDPCADEESRGQRAGAMELRWSVATDAGLRDIVASGSVTARPENAHCVHVDVRGLAPATSYYYRFEAAGYRSPLGRTRTLPGPDAKPSGFRIAMSSCQEYSQGYFTAYRDLLRQQPDLVLHVGDYIYESAAGGLRAYPFDGEAFTLEQYRSLYARYRQDPDLRAAHAGLPWLVLWDDHEVVNDWGPEHYLPSPWNRSVPGTVHRERIVAARRAFLEHMPLRASLALHGGPEQPLYRQLRIGELLELNLLDTRSYRDAPVCNSAAPLEFEPCAALRSDRRSMLGAEQERWLENRLGAFGCRWTCLAQTTLMAPFDRAAGELHRYETDGWDNYPGNRRRLLELIARRRPGKVVSLGGNIHAFYAGILDAALDGGEALLSEVITSSISAGGGGEERYRDVLARRDENPCLRFFDNRAHGYTLLSFGADSLDVRFRVVSDIAVREPDFSTLAAFEIGNAGLNATN